ncbi:hypothetical protein bcCo53_001060 (plasmid) [Borrelia coriaceae]|uniref:Uncharacterized protein n=1 Tax=Borrelia coriaceae ATCC 43381 TaxID=1408429 RepID=W5SXA3_9SPIR|nr:hypothetical protein [Borrelia coriaceae]AHH11502.1 Hypothetical protein BCO_0011305 [Borrelia coriaceae ATCC 43381]UPA16896.1 hypothetical protein bcCo53_001060 [Borrelia coriaceae]
MKRKILKNEITKNGDGVKVKHLSLSNQSNQNKINKIGRKLPKISKNEYFKFNSEVDFSIQRQSLRRIGASEVGSMFIGTDHVSRLAIERILKSLDREIPFKDNLSMRKGKVLENLAFDEFIRIYSDNI